MHLLGVHCLIFPFSRCAAVVIKCIQVIYLIRRSVLNQFYQLYPGMKPPFAPLQGQPVSARKIRFLLGFRSSRGTSFDQGTQCCEQVLTIKEKTTTYIFISISKIVGYFLLTDSPFSPRSPGSPGMPLSPLKQKVF